VARRRREEGSRTDSMELSTTVEVSYSASRYSPTSHKSSLLM
jgi:hypothetical protein